MERTDPFPANARIVELDENDAASGHSLSTAAGWDQTLEDWKLLLSVGQGFGVRTVGGSLVATGIALPYASGFGWIGMLLVHSAYRRQGHASRLLARTIAHLQGLGLVAMLDATPAGRVVYQPLGFVDCAGISRWRRMHGSLQVADRTEGKVSTVLAVDREAFGADRSHLLQSIAGRRGSKVLLGDDHRGYAICRLGRTGVHIGPVVALDPSRLATLVAAALALTEGPAIVDIPDNAFAARAAALAAGFQIERPLTRIALGRGVEFGKPEMIAAIAGPEFG